MTVSIQTFEELVLAHPGRPLEIHQGQVREKPPMEFAHTDLASELGYLLRSQLDRSRFRVHIDGAHLRRLGGATYVPDIAVIPIELARPYLGRRGVLAIYDDPLPLVVEIWSLSTGDYDVTDKLPEYEARGDEEIWLLHPYDRTLTARVRQADGSSVEQAYRGGLVHCTSLPGVVIDLDALFA